jgi:hypothetical protein
MADYTFGSNPPYAFRTIIRPQLRSPSHHDTEICETRLARLGLAQASGATLGWR